MFSFAQSERSNEPQPHQRDHHHPRTATVAGSRAADSAPSDQDSESATIAHEPRPQPTVAELYGVYSRSKFQEWSSKCAYPRGDKIRALLALDVCGLAHGRCCYSFGSQANQMADFAETLRQLGWTPVEAADFRFLNKLFKEQQDSGDSRWLLLAGPDVGTTLRQRQDCGRLASFMVTWEQRLPCLDTYWHLHETLEGHQRSLKMLAHMGLVGDSVASFENAAAGERLGFRDILLDTLHLGEVWGRKLAKFLKQHDSFVIKKASQQERRNQHQQQQTLDFSAEDNEQSGRRRLDCLESALGPGPGAGSCCIVQAACPSPLLVNGRGFHLEVYLLLAPRRNPIEFGFAAFYHPGLVRFTSPAKQQEDQDSTINSWLPEQLFDYLTAADPVRAEWLTSVAYPQVEAACAFLSGALTQQVLDSPYMRFHLLRLSFVLDRRRSRRPRLVDVGQRVGMPKFPDACETLVLPRLLQESALIVSELLLRSQRSWGLQASALVSPCNMRLVFDSAEPAAQRTAIERSFQTGAADA